MAKVVDGELRLEAVDGPGQRRRHDSGVEDQDMQRLAGGRVSLDQYFTERNSDRFRVTPLT